MQARRDRPRRILLGAFVSVAVVLFVVSMLQANALREWFNPSRNLRLVLPDEGLFGLSQGAKIEILGTTAGQITQIVIDPNEKIYAEAKIQPDMAPFVRRDSRGVIRKTFGVAGEAFLEITRGYGEEMDWDYAVLSAAPDRAPTDSIGEIMEDVRSRVIPILEQTERAITALADLTESFANPEGSLQVMLVESLLGNANDTVAAFAPILEEIQTTAEQIASLSESINAQSKELPEINTRISSILTSLDGVLRDLRKTSPELPKITRDVSAATASVPVLMGMTQQTLAELETLLRQLRSSWLLGGGGAPPSADARLPSREVRP
jgi:phospholipid/cholesterol/gamma-HCH transport system substrate-binding protein